MTERFTARHAALRAALEQRGLTALIVTQQSNIRWLTGFSGSAGIALVTADRISLITDFRYEAQAAREAAMNADVLIDRASVWDRLKRVLDARSDSDIGYESQVVSVQDAERIATMVPGRARPVAGLVETLRQVKDPDEVAAIRAAAALAHEALESVIAGVRIGDRELDVAARLEMALRERGSEWHPFPTIVASGPQAALPHARATERRLVEGDMLLIDFGAQVDGYVADITRTFAIGQPDERLVTVFDLVARAQRLAREGIREGMTGREADALARDLICGRGYGDAFGHSLGHGLGLEVHELPRLARTADGTIPAGAVVTVEPGIYLPGWGGVRLEDDVLITPEGPVLLSDGKTDLVVLDS